MSNQTIPGSERKPLRGATLIGPTHPDELMHATLLLRRQNPAALRDRLAALHRGERPTPMTRDAFNALHGASDADIAAVRRFAAANDLAVTTASIARRTVNLCGTVADFQTAFNVSLKNYAHPSGNYRGREGAVCLPPELRDIVQAVLGLDNRKQARPHFKPAAAQAAAAQAAAAQAAAAQAAAPISYTPTELASIYGLPPGKRGAGQAIGIIELGGGSTPADFTTYFQSLGFMAPKLITVSVDNGANAPGGGVAGPDGEVMLDLEVAGAIAPCATLVAYFAPNSDAAFLNAVTTAIHDNENKPSVVSISWGEAESAWTTQAITAFDEAFQDAAILGVTICIASGDHGSNDDEPDAADHVNFPASSPHALACGGTSLQASGVAIISERVWNDAPNPGASGGGISTAFPTVPEWQHGLSAALTKGGATPLTGRGVPDVAGNADPQTGYKVRVDGTDTVIGGTSAVAPFWAGLVARLNAERGTPLGFINPLLYANKEAFRDITAGDNGSFAATAGWDAATGLGSPDGELLWVRLGAAPAVRDEKLLVRGNNVLARGGSAMTKMKPDALLVRGEDVVAGGDVVATGGAPSAAAAEPDALLVRGEAMPAIPAGGTGGTGGIEPDALYVRGE